VDLGDNTISFSDLTLNHLSYQGAGVTLKPSRNFALTIIGGSRGNGLWGADVRRDTRPKENFTGVKSVFAPFEELNFNATYLTAQGGSQVLSYGSDFSLNNIRLGMEFGSAGEGKAFQGEIGFKSNWFNLGTIYRDVDSTYLVPFDYISYKGKKGTYSSIGIKPISNLSINVQNNSYLDKLNGDPTITNIDTSGDISYNMETGTNVGYSGWRNDRPSYDRGGISEGEIMYITQTFYLLTRNAIYYRFQPTWFESRNASEESYAENKNIAGLNISLFDAAHLNYEIENTIKLLKNTDITINPSAISVRFDLFENRIMESPFYMASSINSRTDSADKDSDKSALTYSEVTLKYIPSQDLSCFITSRTYKMDSPEEARTAREQTDLSFGLKYSFNTNFYLK